jgi:uncharacterized protein (TIGR03000 family)
MFVTRFDAATVRSRLFPIGMAALLAVVALAAGLAVAQIPPGASMLWPWNVSGYQGYAPPETPATLPRAPEPIRPSATPRQYTLQVAKLPAKNEDSPDTAVIVAHLPEDAEIWVEDSPTTQKGTVRQFVSPPLTPGKEYKYTVRVAWEEEGGKVSQVHTFPIRAGKIHCVDVVKADAPSVTAEVKANLDKLDPEDKKLAEAQTFCAVQNGIRLGAMGVPVKVMVKGQPVLLCCEGCVDRAKNKPDQVLDNVQKLKEHQHPSPEK